VPITTVALLAGFHPRNVHPSQAVVSGKPLNEILAHGSATTDVK
jgi:hypothetical protein